MLIKILYNKDNKIQMSLYFKRQMNGL